MSANIDRQKKWLLLPLVGFLLMEIPGCSFKNEYPGFSQTSSGVYYRLNVMGEGELNPVPGDYITVDLRYSTTYDSVFFTARRKFQLEQPAFKGSVEECFAMMRTGDEADFIINAHDFFNKTLDVKIPRFLEGSDHLKISVKMIEIQTSQSYIHEKQAFLSWIEDFGEYERFRIENFIRQEQIEAEPDRSGLYYININEGTGKKVEHGDTVEVHYEGRFLDGKFFDSTRKRDEVFQFVYGQELQLIQGLEKAVGLMREGARALVIIPSELAFGSHGSSTGIIPPYTSMVYEVEVLSVR